MKTLQDAVNELLESQSYRNNGTPEIYGEVQHMEVNDMHIIYFESTQPTLSQRMKRYHMAVYGWGLFGLSYQDSNVIDIDKSYTLEDVKRKALNYHTHHANKLK